MFPPANPNALIRLILFPFLLLLTVECLSAQSWKDWLLQYDLVGLSEYSDTDRDNQSALMEYFLGSDPTAFSPVRPTRPGFDKAAGVFTLSLQSNWSDLPEDLHIRLVRSTDLSENGWEEQAYGFNADPNIEEGYTHSYEASVPTGEEDSQFFRLIIDQKSADPEISPIPNQRIQVGSGTIELPFQLKNIDTDSPEFQLTVSSSHSSILPHPSIQQTGDPDEWLLSLSPPIGTLGVSLIELAASDDSRVARRSFHAEVVGSNGEEADGYDIILVWGQSNERGVDDTVILAKDTDPTGRIQQFALSGPDTGKIIDIDDGTIYYPIAPGRVVGPGFSFAKAYGRAIPENRKILIVPVCVGGTSFIGNPRWNPYGDGSDQNGDLYHLAISAMNEALIAAKEIHPNSKVVGFFGAPGENDSKASNYSDFMERLTQAVRGFRESISGANNAWAIKPGMVPEWALSGAFARALLDAAQVRAESRLPYYAFSDGVEGHQFVNSDGDLEAIHYNAEGNRIRGANAAALVPVAKSRSQPVRFPSDLYSGIGSENETSVARPELAIGLRRMVHGYEGPALQLRHSDTGALANVYFQANGEIDYKSMKIFADGGDCFVTRFFDQSGHGRDLVSPNESLQSQLVMSGVIQFQGRRPVFNRDKRTGYYEFAGTINPEFATVVGRFPLRNSVVLGTDTLMLYRPGGAPLTIQPGSRQLVNDFGEKYVSIAADASSQRIWVNGVDQASQDGPSSNYSGPGVSFMALDQTGTKAVRGEFSELVLFGSGLREDQIDKINADLALYSAWNSFESANP